MLAFMRLLLHVWGACASALHLPAGWMRGVAWWPLKVHRLLLGYFIYGGLLDVSALVT